MAFVDLQLNYGLEFTVLYPDEVGALFTAGLTGNWFSSRLFGQQIN